MIVDLARIAMAAPLLVAGQAITTLAYRVAGAAHLNPHRRTS